MSRIQLLDERLVSKIAAGEVVERPASVVKELVENSLDAGAGDLRVELEKGGKRRMVVADDGIGMDADDALLAFDSHATSKIGTFDDLEHVETLGFRGEALASIAAVARVELRTAERPGEGHRVRIDGGKVRKVEPVSHPKGTRIEVASLFFNVPARRKFLKQPSTELRRCVEVVQGYALAHPDVRFALRHEDRTLLETVPVDDSSAGLGERIAQVFGRRLVDRLVPLAESYSGESEAICGFVGDRDTARGRRIFVFVNRRLVRDRAILARFYRSVRDEWKSEEYPALFLLLDLPAEDVDVNVHPQKAEVRFRRTEFLDRMEGAIREALKRARGEEPAPLRRPESLPAVRPAWEGLGGRGPSENRGPAQDGTLLPPDMTPASGVPAGTGTSDTPRAPAIAQPTFRPMEPRAVPLSGRSGEPRAFRLLGQYKGSLILLEGPDGLYLIDQHVAHERILYERVRRSLLAEESAPSQTLLVPLILELGPAEALRLADLAPALEPCGFPLTVLSGNTIALRAIPTMLTIDQAEAVLQELATGSEEIDTGSAEEKRADLRRRLLESLAASLACRAAIKIHHPLTMDKMEALISELFEAEQPFACPHGRPAILRMTDAELERRFERR